MVVGTPGRMIDLLKQRHLDLSHVKAVVLDEADEMLDLGFLPDVETLLAATPASRHTMLFSATMPGAVVAMARRYMTQPTHIRAADPDDDGQTVKNIKQVVYRAHALDKVEMLARILQARGRGLTIVFARTKRTAAKVADDLVERGFAAGALHGDLGQGAREQALRAFRHGKVDVLVATDVAARGIDVEAVTHVINYQCPEDEKTYLHRTGRTGRAGTKGIAVTFVDWDDIPRWGLIDKALDLGIPASDRVVLQRRRTSTRTSTSPRAPRAACRRRSRPARAWARRCSRTSARPGSEAAAAAVRPARTPTRSGATAAATRVVAPTPVPATPRSGDSRRRQRHAARPAPGPRRLRTRPLRTRPLRRRPHRGPSARRRRVRRGPRGRLAPSSGRPRPGSRRGRRATTRRRRPSRRRTGRPSSRAPRARRPAARRRSRSRRRTRSGQSAEGGGAPQASATEG